MTQDPWGENQNPGMPNTPGAHGSTESAQGQAWNQTSDPTVPLQTQ